MRAIQLMFHLPYYLAIPFISHSYLYIFLKDSNQLDFHKALKWSFDLAVSLCAPSLTNFFYSPPYDSPIPVFTPIHNILLFFLLKVIQTSIVVPNGILFCGYMVSSLLIKDLRAEYRSTSRSIYTQLPERMNHQYL